MFSSRAVQISRRIDYLDGLSPLLSMSVLTITESGFRPGTRLSKLALRALRGPKGHQVLARRADFGPWVATRAGTAARNRSGAVQVAYFRKPNLDKPGFRPALCRPIFSIKLACLARSGWNWKNHSSWHATHQALIVPSLLSRSGSTWPPPTLVGGRLWDRCGELHLVRGLGLLHTLAAGMA
jgi:hypothetical protein